ncbi:hypothetical protein C5167_019063 [Papaver somniferum]|uniref:Uncharacterized protein n=1 Tax=Papaver somniferum TaxID=3469 RepID=A0A4Y7IP39_PAPSO|nr:hypothetical protein C5167_019063 [Papaver somniferum]
MERLVADSVSPLPIVISSSAHRTKKEKEKVNDIEMSSQQMPQILGISHLDEFPSISESLSRQACVAPGKIERKLVIPIGSPLPDVKSDMSVTTSSSYREESAS